MYAPVEQWVILVFRQRSVTLCLSEKPAQKGSLGRREFSAGQSDHMAEDTINEHVRTAQLASCGRTDQLRLCLENSQILALPEALLSPEKKGHTLNWLR